MSAWQWLMPWDPSPTTAFVALAVAALYLRGGGSQAPGRKILFWSGLLCMYIVLMTRFDYYAEHSFFMGRIQQGVLQHFGPFLIALSAPWAALRSGMPRGLKGAIDRFRKSFAFEKIAGFLSHPVTAVILFDGLILFWMIPDAHFFAMLDWRLYRLMNGSMVVNGLMFWSIVLQPQSKYGVGTRILMMLAVIPAQIMLGAVLTFSPREIYPVYAICGRAFAGLTPLADQGLGGIVLWIHGAMMSVIGILIVTIVETRRKNQFPAA